MSEILHAIETTAGGHFLKADPSGGWQEISEGDARDKVGHALRDAAAEAKRQGARDDGEKSSPPRPSKKRRIRKAGAASYLKNAATPLVVQANNLSRVDDNAISLDKVALNDAAAETKKRARDAKESPRPSKRQVVSADYFLKNDATSLVIMPPKKESIDFSKVHENPIFPELEPWLHRTETMDHCSLLGDVTSFEHDTTASSEKRKKIDSRTFFRPFDEDDMILLGYQDSCVLHDIVLCNS